MHIGEHCYQLWVVAIIEILITEDTFSRQDNLLFSFLSPQVELSLAQFYCSLFGTTPKVPSSPTFIYFSPSHWTSFTSSSSFSLVVVSVIVFLPGPQLIC